MTVKVRVTATRATNRPGVLRHELDNGLFAIEDPRAGSYRFKLYRPGRAKPEDPKLLATATTRRGMLRAARGMV